MFIDQSLPFPTVTPIRLPDIVHQLTLTKNKIDYTWNLNDNIEHLSRLSEFFKAWFNPLINLNDFNYVYFMNNGITQALDFIAIHNKNINMLLGDYFWLKTNGGAVEIESPVKCDISYASNPSAIDGNITNTVWDSNRHILDGAYVGTSTIPTIVPKNTEIILLSFSKNLGLPELRAGFIFSKKRLQSLEVLQRTFGYVNVYPFLIAEKICEKYQIMSLADRLTSIQREYCRNHSMFTPSDSALIATSVDKKFYFYKRPNGILRIPLGESISSWIMR